MNEIQKGSTMAQQKTLMVFFDRLILNLDRIEKQRYRLDNTCDRLDYSEYYKNHPQEVSDKCAPSTPDESDVNFLMEKIIDRFEREEYKLGMAIDFVSNFI